MAYSVSLRAMRGQELLIAEHVQRIETRFWIDQASLSVQPANGFPPRDV